MGRTRRQIVRGAILMAACLVAGPGVRRSRAATGGRSDADKALAFIEDITGRRATPSDRVALRMPSEFPTGYVVPIDIEVDSPMTREDHVRSIRVFAPENPLVEVAGFHFLRDRSLPRVSTRIRLARRQDVIAIADMSDGRLLLATAHVNVASNGCE